MQIDLAVLRRDFGMKSLTVELEGISPLIVWRMPDDFGCCIIPYTPEGGTVETSQIKPSMAK